MHLIFLVVAALALACAAKDLCSGVMPVALPGAVFLEHAPFDRIPFRDALVGDGAGSIAFLIRGPLGKDYFGTVYDIAGNTLTGLQGRFAEDVGSTRAGKCRRLSSSAPRPLDC